MNRILRLAAFCCACAGLFFAGVAAPGSRAESSRRCPPRPGRRCSTRIARPATPAPRRRTRPGLEDTHGADAGDCARGADHRDYDRAGAELTDEEKRAIAEYLGGRPLDTKHTGDAASMANHCATNPPPSDPASGPQWNGWSASSGNTRFAAADIAGLSASDVPQLKLKWAFGFPNGDTAYGQPAVVGGRVYIGSDAGYVYSLDAATGCVYWSFHAHAGVRTAPTIGR